MYCKTCGQQSSAQGNYCIHDGTSLLQDNVTFKANGKRKFCQDCGTEGESQQNYCLTCGSELNLYANNRGKLFKAGPQTVKEEGPTRKPLSLPKFSIGHFKLALIPVLISFFILSVISFAILSVSQDFARDFIMSSDSEISEFTEMFEYMTTETDVELPDLTKIIGIRDIILYSNLQSSSFDFKVTGEDGWTGTSAVQGNVDIMNGSFIYILIPFISLFVGGVVLGLRNRGNHASLLTLNVAMGIIYGFVLAIVSLFAGFSYKWEAKTEYLNFGINMANNYSFFSTLLLSFILAFIFGGLGLLFAQNYRKTTGHLSKMVPYGEAIHQAFSTLVRGMVLLFIIFTIYLSSKVHELKEGFGTLLVDTPFASLLEKGTMFVLTISAQLSNYVWNLLHFASLTFSGKEGGEKGAITYSVFNGLNSSGDNMDLWFLESMLESSNLGLYLKLAIIVPILLFVWSGYKMAIHQENIMIQVAVFSFIYALLMGGLASLTDTGFAMEMKEMGSGSEEMGLSLGFSPFGVFIRSFFFAFILSYAGTWVRKLKS